MGFMDSVKGLVNKGKDYASKNPDKADQFIEKVGDQVDGRTGGKYTQHVDKAQDAARQHLGTTDNPAPGAQPGPGGEPGPEGGPGPEAQPGPREP
ncbi:antitoxin [Rhodococcus pyridinivorans]|uniref:antitoxin n=1 Tax=Rhodococcus pyridinivorans TaxID=103816 RepID=UPI00110EDFDD|nr:antitoxin [Rhodococcus pyridinivorans]